MVAPRTTVDIRLCQVLVFTGSRTTTVPTPTIIMIFWVDLEDSNPTCDCQWFTDLEETNGVPSAFFQAEISATLG